MTAGFAMPASSSAYPKGHDARLRFEPAHALPATESAAMTAGGSHGSAVLSPALSGGSGMLSLQQGGPRHSLGRPQMGIRCAY